MENKDIELLTNELDSLNIKKKPVVTLKKPIVTKCEKKKLTIKPRMKPVFRDGDLWNLLQKCEKEECISIIKFALLEFGTREPCNRFDVGNSIEFLLGHMLKKAGANVMELPNEKRVDLCINSYYKISIKYSSSGDITLHNSNGSVNKDLVMTDLLLLTPKKLYLITNKELCEYGIDVTKYLKNTGDSLRLKRSLLPVLARKKYQYIMDFNIEIDKSQCKNRLTSKIFFEYLLCQFSKE